MCALFAAVILRGGSNASSARRKQRRDEALAAASAAGAKCYLERVSPILARFAHRCIVKAKCGGDIVARRGTLRCSSSPRGEGVPRRARAMM